jgi:hypothetical protein
MRSKTACFVLISSFMNAACVETLPPPPPPAQESVPSQVRLLPPAPGKGRVVIDVTNGPARVVEVVAHGTSVTHGRRRSYFSEGEITRPVCVTTPCAANFDFGQHELRFISQTEEVSWGEGTVNVDGNDAIFLHTMGRDDEGGAVHRTGNLLAGLGFIGGLVGGGLILAGAISNASSQDGSHPGQGVITGGEVTLGIGLGMLVAGLVMDACDPSRVQQGSSSQFSIGAPPAQAPAQPVATPPPTTDQSL